MEKEPSNSGPTPGSWISLPFSLFHFRIAVAALIVVLTLSLAQGAAAQSCAMCYDSAKQQGSEAASALNTGILILLLPSVMLFGGVLATALRRRANANEED